MDSIVKSVTDDIWSRRVFATSETYDKKRNRCNEKELSDKKALALGKSKWKQFMDGLRTQEHTKDELFSLKSL